MKWILIEFVPPPQGVFIQTKIDDKDGARNFQEMKFEKNLWWTDDGMYVYWRPTHWAHVDIEKYSKYSQRECIW